MNTAKWIIISLAAAFALSLGLEFFDDMYSMELDDIIEDSIKYGFFITVPVLIWRRGSQKQS